MVYSACMGRRPVENKKPPSEYPQFSFRVSKADKARLTEIVEQIQDRMNRQRKEGEPWVNKNDVIIRALNEGLKRIK